MYIVTHRRPLLQKAMMLWMSERAEKGIKLYVSDISLAKDYARYDKEFKEIFGLK